MHGKEKNSHTSGRSSIGGCINFRLPLGSILCHYLVLTLAQTRDRELRVLADGERMAPMARNHGQKCMQRMGPSRRERC